MARDEVKVVLPVQEATNSIEYETVAKTTVSVENGVKIVEALANKNNSLQIFVETTSADSTVTVKAGNNYPNAILGDLIVPVKGSAITVILLEDISRFENRDNSIELDFGSGFTGNIWATAKRAGIAPVVEE